MGSEGYRAVMSTARSEVAMFASKFGEIRRECERAIAQLDTGMLRRSLDGDTNSVAIILKHVGANLTSRFTNFLSEDGEKSWRQRDGEFIDDFAQGEEGRRAILAAWSAGWSVLEGTLASLRDEDLDRTVHIRGQPHSVRLALLRSAAHLAYHQGQITLIARILVGPERWQTISIPRGGSRAFNERLGYTPGSSH